MKTYTVVMAAVLLLAFGAAGSGWAQKATLQFSGMTPHLGEALSIRVVDKANGEEVGREKITVKEAVFEVPLWVLATGHSYRFDFYADRNQNGKYDAPPGDHAWSLETNNAAGNVVLAFSHNTNFTDIAWPEAPAWVDYLGTWQGTWHNLTYGVTAPVTATLWSSPDGDSLYASVVTSGVFGNPAPYRDAAWAANDPTADSLVISASASAPWTGQYIIRKGNGHATLNAAAMGVVVKAVGHFGPHQMVMGFTMSGVFSANGVVFMNKVSETGIELEAGAPTPEVFGLDQNYPNPFNPVTFISFSVPEAGQVRLTVYDMLGRAVAVLEDGVVGPGAHQVAFNAAGLSSGIFFYRLETGGKTFARKMVLSD
jgi:hypothetical protein